MSRAATETIRLAVLIDSDDATVHADGRLPS